MPSRDPRRTRGESAGEGRDPADALPVGAADPPATGPATSGDAPGQRTRSAMGSTGVRGAAASAQSGHHDERRRSRPGRIRCSSGVATKTWPTSHCQVRRTSAAGGTWVSVIPRLNSGWYCRMSTGNDAHASR
ncbi:hypothetical protein BFL36_04670 [Clavibacter michiganensis]|uniref:Uncharacterized protein n=1 Tax=Clavibacter michiganensis TaxID=28447 RepID=A0A251YNU6_9MICO|nr:hypothetical protein BFL36_04670 [Clavibacter michiganensis]